MHSRHVRDVGQVGGWLLYINALVEGFASECEEVVECGTLACGLLWLHAAEKAIRA